MLLIILDTHSLCLDELLAAAKRLETDQRQTTYGFIAGMLVLAGSIFLLS